MSIQAKGANKNILTSKKKNQKVISPPKVPLKSTIKKKPSAEGNKFKHLKDNNNNINKCDFKVAFVMAHIIKYYNESYAEDKHN